MKKNVLVSVSTDPIQDYQSIVNYAKDMQGKADFLHCDVMDGVFVERKTISAQLVSNVNSNSSIMLDVHLMCDEPLKSIKEFARAGANIITIHYEAFKDKTKIDKAIDEIHANNCLAGIAISPDTPVKEIKIYLYKLDLMLVMSVVPGLSGQKFMPNSLEKIKELDKIRKENSFSYKIEVDGGINQDTALKAVEAGVDMLVSGSYVYNSKDQAKVIKELKSL